ncbi:MAG: glycosyltransferase family 2 protein [Proteobacteria bacterium]|nr:glycosyltransferase family 2 protein [Burkholderiales bacterium]
MEVHLYTICWNEADMLGFFFRHYDPVVTRYFIYDNGSTDGSLDLLSAHPNVVLRKFPFDDANSFVNSARAFHNTAWKESRGSADWVILTAIDEHLHVPGTHLRDYLTQELRAKTTLIPALGYQMLSEDFALPEEELCLSRTTGAPFIEMSKLSLFRPDEIHDTNFASGRHTAAPSGLLRMPRNDRLLNLHYKYLGFERVVERQQFLRTGLRSVDIENQYGWQYWKSAEYVRQDWNKFLENAADIAAPGFNAAKSHLAPRWWRPSMKRILHVRRKWALFWNALPSAHGLYFGERS